MPNERYDFDKNGNRIKADIQNKEQTYKTAEYNRLISDSESEYKYDLEGNRISKISNDGSTIKYYWDNRNRLIKIETPNGSIEYIYDHLNRLVLRKQGESITTFIHDGWQIILQFDNDKPTHRYLWGTKQDELICDNDNWTLGDHLNTIRDIVKSDGTVTDHLEYNSFGKIITATKNDLSLQFAYTGKLTDKSSDLQWNINRWYDANVGRWVSEDPIGFKGGDVNLLRYTLNTPCCYVDTSGNFPIILPVIVAAVTIYTPAACWRMFEEGLLDFGARSLSTKEIQCIKKAISYLSTFNALGSPDEGWIQSSRYYAYDGLIPYSLIHAIPCRNFAIVFPESQIDCSTCTGIAKLMTNVIHENVHLDQFFPTGDAAEDQAAYRATQVMTASKKNCGKIVKDSICSSTCECEKAMSYEIELENMTIKDRDKYNLDPIQ
jgi:RHS repeat-associated protein